MLLVVEVGVGDSGRLHRLVDLIDVPRSAVAAVYETRDQTQYDWSMAGSPPASVNAVNAATNPTR